MSEQEQEPAEDTSDLYATMRFRLVEFSLVDPVVTVVYDRLYGGNWVLSVGFVVSPRGRIHKLEGNTHPDVMALKAWMSARQSPPIQGTLCGPTGDEMVCACGCGADDSRCDYWIACRKLGQEVADSHRCCQVGNGQTGGG